MPRAVRFTCAAGSSEGAGGGAWRWPAPRNGRVNSRKGGGGALQAMLCWTQRRRWQPATRWAARRPRSTARCASLASCAVAHVARARRRSALCCRRSCSRTLG
eukprot:24106-Chlamydomonas_euryale.AAC.2